MSFADLCALSPVGEVFELQSLTYAVINCLLPYPNANYRRLLLGPSGAIGRGESESSLRQAVRFVTVFA